MGMGAQATNGAATIPLLQPTTVGQWQLSSKMVYAPLTRCRSERNVPQSESMAKYYSQRAHKGMLMLSEATTVQETGYGYPRTPGIHTQEQMDAWKPIVKAVKDKGAIFLCQLWHVGRVSHSEFQPGKALPISASPIAIPNHKCGLPNRGSEPYETPRELREDELPGIVQWYIQAAKNALACGFDGVEVHCANGYLLDSFAKSSANQRTDRYGGSIENRARLVLEVIRAVADAIGAEKVGVRFSPFYVMGAEDPHKYAQFTYMLEELNDLGLAYVHMVEPRAKEGHMEGSPAAVYEYRKKGETLDVYRNAYKGTFLVAGGHTRESGIQSLQTNHADLVVYGRSWLANPDLPERFELDAELNDYDRATFYAADQVKGFTDYPTLTQEQVKAAKQKQTSSTKQHTSGKGAADGHAENAHLGNAY